MIMNTYKNKPTVSTLECEGLFPCRMMGNTTRQIDFAIQKLHEGYVVILEDHHEWGGSRKSNMRLTELLYKRLAMEHSHLFTNALVVIEKKTNMFDHKSCHIILLEEREDRLCNPRIPSL